LWVGTGIGLVKEVMAAKDIVIEVREGIHKAMEITRARM